MNNAVRLTFDGPIAHLVLSNGPGRNILTKDMADGLVEACNVLNSDLAARCVVLSAEGDVFSSGGNIKDMYNREHHFAGNPAENRRYYGNGVQRIVRAIYDLEAPIVAAVQGPAIGFGLDLALMCDMRICSTKALFGETFVKLGLCSAAGGAWLLPRIVGPAAAAELTLTGDRIDAARALQLGIVSQVTEPDELLPTALKLAERVAANPPHSVRLNKRLLRESMRSDLTTALELAASMQGIAQHTDDQHEAVAAVVEKRPATYVGR